MRIDKNGEEITKTISYRLQFIDNTGFMASLLSNLVDNPSERLHKLKCTSSRKCCLEYSNFKEGLIEFKCFFVY